MKKKTIIITGASSGMGKAIYDNYKACEIYNVIGISRHGPDVLLNLASAFDLNTMLSGAGVKVDKVDLLINCAGIMPLVEIGKEQKIMNTNFWGTYDMMNQCLPKLQPGSCVINIASISATNPDEHQPVYAASKAAIIALTKSLAKRYASSLIRFNCVSPGFVATNLVEGDTPQELIDTIPLGYEIKPNELIRLVDTIWQTSYMTGSNIVVDGGLTL